MKLTLDRIRSITKGAENVTEENGKINFFRFTEKEALTHKPDYRDKCYATAGIRFAFRTNSKHVGFDYCSEASTSRLFGYFDVYVDGAMTAHLGSDEPNCGRADVRLPTGEKTVEIYFPWSLRTRIIGLEIDDGASLEPVSRKLKMLALGDSITHGYDAKYPSLSYASRLGRIIGADQINKAIGGEKFDSETLLPCENGGYDLITVAYGTNDWSNDPKDVVLANMREYYLTLSRLYPETPIFALAPIYRGNANAPETSAFGEKLTNVCGYMRENTADLKNVKVVDCYNFVPHLPEFFSHDFLHPNDFGFGSYVENLATEILKNL